MAFFVICACYSWAVATLLIDEFDRQRARHKAEDEWQPPHL